MNLKNTLVVYTTPRSKEQASSLDFVRKTLKKYSAGFSLANRDRLSKAQFKGKGLIIAVGGDGTFLRAAQFVGNQMLLGVNADVRRKEGFFMKSSRHNFEKNVGKMISNSHNVIMLPRLEAFINGKRIDALALNEFFIGARKSYQSARYSIKVGAKKERQKSSGVLAATPAGSNSWAKSSCGKLLPLSSKMYQFVVREPYERRIFKGYRLKQGILGKNQKLDVFSEMLDGILIADSVGKEYRLKHGDNVTIRMSSKPLNVVWDEIWE